MFNKFSVYIPLFMSRRKFHGGNKLVMKMQVFANRKIFLVFGLHQNEGRKFSFTMTACQLSDKNKDVNICFVLSETVLIFYVFWEDVLRLNSL